MVYRFLTLAVGLGLLVSAALAADDKPVRPPAPKPQEAKTAPPAAPAANRPPATRAPKSGVPDNHPGEQQLDKLLKMSPAERQRALQNLPPARRENIERRLSEIQKLPPAAQNRARTRLEMLNSLPPQRQNQVRRSAQQFQALPPERRQQMNQELLRMAPLPDEERRAYMNTEEFRNRYSANEQQIMSNLSRITPEIPPKD